MPGLAGVEGLGNLRTRRAAGDGRARGEVLSFSGGGDGCGVNIRAAYAFFGCGDRIT